MSPHNL